MFKRLVLILFSWLIFVATPTWADLDYTSYYITSYAPSLEFPYYDNVAGYNSDGSNSSPSYLSSVLSTGTMSGISGYNWGSVLDSGRSDYVALEITGYITWPGTAGVSTTVYFGVRADDGVFMNIDGTNVIQDWQQQGGATWNAQGSITLTGGQEYPITVWWYEWGGGAELDINYSLTDYQYSNQANIPTSWLSTTSTSSSSSATPSYSSGPTSAQQTRINSNRSAISSGSSNDIDINITGDSNDIFISQAGEPSLLLLNVTGNLNDIDIDQDASTSATSYGHYTEAEILGDSNILDLTQTGSGNHTAFIDVNGDSNSATLIQKDGGNHYLQLDLIGDNNTATITQQGAGDHAATVELTESGGSWTFSLDQNGTNDKTYSLPHSMSDESTTSGTCYTSAGCSLTVTQGD